MQTGAVVLGIDQLINAASALVKLVIGSMRKLSIPMVNLNAIECLYKKKKKCGV